MHNFLASIRRMLTRRTSRKQPKNDSSIYPMF